MIVAEAARVLCYVAASRNRSGCARADVVRGLAEAAIARCAPSLTAAEHTRILLSQEVNP